MKARWTIRKRWHLAVWKQTWKAWRRHAEPEVKVKREWDRLWCLLTRALVPKTRPCPSLSICSSDCGERIRWTLRNFSFGNNLSPTRYCWHIVVEPLNMVAPCSVIRTGRGLQPFFCPKCWLARSVRELKPSSVLLKGEHRATVFQGAWQLEPFLKAIGWCFHNLFDTLEEHLGKANENRYRALKKHSPFYFNVKEL